jgi:hypothetical protein
VLTHCSDAVAALCPLQGLRQSIDRAKLRQQQHQQQQEEDVLSSPQQQQQSALSTSAHAVSRAMQQVRTDTAAAAAVANTNTISSSSATDDAETPVPSAPLPGSPSDSDHEGEVYGRTGRRSVGVSRVVRRRPSAAAIAAPAAAAATPAPAAVAAVSAAVAVPAASRWAQWTPTSALPYMPSAISSSASTALLPGAATLTGERLRAVHSDLVAVLGAIQQLADSSSDSSRRATTTATAATAGTAASDVYGETGSLSAFVAQLSRPRARHSLSDGAEQAAWQQLKDYDALVRTAAGTPLESRANSIGV